MMESCSCVSWGRERINEEERVREKRSGGEAEKMRGKQRFRGGSDRRKGCGRGRRKSEGCYRKREREAGRES